MRAWFLTYGEPPRARDWGTSRDTPERSARYRRLRGRVPSTAAVYRIFGSWNAAIAAAGYRPRTSGGQPGETWAFPRPRPRMDRCKRGHEMEGRNILIDYNGKRRCRACQLMHQRNTKARKQARARGLLV